MLAILGLQAIIIIILLVYIGHAYSQIKQLRKALESASVSYSPASSVSGTIPGNASSEGADCFPESSASSSGMFSEDEELFEHIHQTILSEKLFLNPEFSREHFLRLGLINKNKAAQLLRQYAHTNFNGYINHLRLEHALNLLEQCPDTPIKAVAYESGFNNVRTFYRIFEQEYGKTPTLYRNEILNLRQSV